ncbi:MAG: tagatose 1,6-diphosphate aldolase, partial [Pseudomonadota bacterium]
HLGVEKAPWQEVAQFKNMLVEQLQAQASAMLLDPHYAIPRSVGHFDPKKGLIVTLEDSQFQDTQYGRLSSQIDDWSVVKIKRMGADALKVLAWYRPDAPKHICQAQQDFAKQIGEECARYDIPFLFELLLYPLANDEEQTQDYVEMAAKKSDHVMQSLHDFSGPEFGIDIFKLESPINASSLEKVDNAQDAFDEMGQLVGRPWVMLSAGAGKAEFKKILEHAFSAGASGFLAGRAIWMDAFAHYPDWQKIEQELAGGANDYMRDICELCDAQAKNWQTHSCYGQNGAEFSPSDANFRHDYAEM